MSTPIVTPNLLAQMRTSQAPMPALPAAPVMPSAMSLPVPAAPLVGKIPTAMDLDQKRVNDLHTQGSGIDQIHNPLLRGIARAGDIAASVFGTYIPAVRTLDAVLPGTTLHHQVLVNQAERNLANDQANTQAQAQQAQEAATTAQTQANTDYLQQKPEIESAKIQQKQSLQDTKNQTALAGKGITYTRNPDGTVDIADDPTSEVFQRNQIKEQLLNAQVDSTHAQEELRNAQTDYDQAKVDPSSPLFKQVAQRLAIAQQNANAANLRAHAYMGNYLQHAYNKGLNGETLPGAPQIEDNAGNVATVGSTNAGQAVKAQANAAQFGDVHGALDNLEQKARALVQSGGRLNSPGVVYALQHLGTGTPSQIIESINKANLSPQERDYVISNLAAHENVQALRKSAGGTATDTSVAKLDALLPNGATPDLDYLLNQTGQIRQTAERLGKGVTVVKGGLGVPGGHANNEGGKQEPKNTADPLGIR